MLGRLHADVFQKLENGNVQVPRKKLIQIIKIVGNLFFDVYIYPRVIEVLFLLFAFVFLLYAGKLVGMITAVIFMTVFAKGYYDLLKAAYHSLDEIFG